MCCSNFFLSPTHGGNYGSNSNIINTTVNSNSSINSSIQTYDAPPHSPHSYHHDEIQNHLSLSKLGLTEINYPAELGIVELEALLILDVR